MFVFVTVGHGCLPNLLETKPLKIVDVQTDYLDYYTRNIQYFDSSLICVISNIDKTTNKYFK